MTAGEAATRPDVRLRAAGAAKCQDRAVVAVLRGWTRGHASKRASILAALTAEGVDVATIPKLTAAEQEEMRQKARPCPACAAKDEELSRTRADAAALVSRLAETEAQRGAAWAAEEALRARVAELEAPPVPDAQPPVTPPPVRLAAPPVTHTPPSPTTRPREKCKVSLEMDGRNLLAKAVTA